MRFVIIVAGLVGLAAAVPGQELPRASNIVERTRIGFFSQPFKSLRGERAEFFVRLPEHVTYGIGSALNLALDFSTNALPYVLGVNAFVNFEAFAISTNGFRTQTTLPAKLLQPGWNRIAIELRHHDSSGAVKALAEPGAWGLWASNTFLAVAYKRMPLFPELARFPQTYAEENLLHPDAPKSEIFLSGQRRHVYARALAILGTRFGQIDAPVPRVRPLTGWTANESDPGAILVGRLDELPPLPLPREIQAARERLGSGEGLLAEWILGPRRRCLLVTGADDTGLERALLTLGSSPALIWAPPSPVLIDSVPEPRLDLAYLARPHTGSVEFETLGWTPLLLRGALREETLSGWRLPPNYTLNGNSRLQLNIISAPGLTNSFLDVSVNAMSVGHVHLTPEFANLSSATLDFPAGLRGRDPMTLSFRSRLTSSQPTGTNSAPWVSILGTSRLQLRPRPMEPRSLEQLPAVLFPDPFLNQLAFALPNESSWEDLNFFLALTLQVGRGLPSAMILWPEALFYSTRQPCPPERVASRHVVVLGTASQWRHAFPRGTPLYVNLVESGNVTMQGRAYSLDSFEPDLALAQLIRSPWNSGRAALAAGSWNSFAVAPLPRLLLEPDGGGNIRITDAKGRTTAYDTRNGNSESLAERIHRDLPAGLTAQETRIRRGVDVELAKHSAFVNGLVWVFTPALLCVLIGARLWLTWDQQQQRRKAVAKEKPLGSTV